MKAIVCRQYGLLDELTLMETGNPSPKDDEVLVRIHASSVNFNNLANVTGKPFLARFWFGLLKPKYRIPGNDIAGRVEFVGKSVKHFKAGDEVFGDSSNHTFGAYAQYASVPENALALKPVNLSFTEAAVVPEASVVALQGLRKEGQIKPGQKVLIYGASGGIGTFAVQIAKSFGAEVTGVCSTGNMEMVLSIGADHVIDYTREDFIKQRQSYDLILATAGYQSIFKYRRLLRSRGIYVATGGSLAQIFQGMLMGPLVSMKSNKNMSSLTAKANQEDLRFIKELIEAGSLKPIIDRCYPFTSTAEALGYYAKGHSKGKVAITIQ